MRRGRFGQAAAVMAALCLLVTNWASVRADSTVTITLWDAWNGAQATAINTLASQFMALHPGIKVELVSSSNYTALQQKEQSAIFAGNTPTLGQAYESWVAGYIKSNAVENLAPYINNKKTGLTRAQINDFYPGMWADGLLGKQRLMMPVSKSDEVMYFDGSMLRAAGIKSAPKTWTQFAADCKKVTKLEAGRPTQWCATITNAESTWFIMQNEWGNKVLKGSRAAFGNSRGAAPVQFWVNLIKKHQVVFTTQAGYPDQADIDSGKSAFYFGSSAGVTYVLGGAKPGVAIGEAPMPAGPKLQGTEMYGAPMIMFKKATAAEKQAGWLFMKYLTQPTQTAFWAVNTGYMPVRKSASKLTTLQAFFKSHPQQRAPLEQLSHVFFEPTASGWTKSISDISAALTTAYSLNKSPLQAMRDAATQVNSDMAQQ